MNRGPSPGRDAYGPLPPVPTKLVFRSLIAGLRHRGAEVAMDGSGPNAYLVLVTLDTSPHLLFTLLHLRGSIATLRVT